MSTAVSSAEVSCPICLDVFDVPKSLNCGHSFCATCVSPIIRNGKVKCPECRKDTIVPSTGLVTNIAMHRLTEQMNGINLVTVVETNMSAEVESMAKRVVWKAVNDNIDKESPHMEMAVSGIIAERFNKKYGKHWQCIVRDKNINNFGWSLASQNYICLEARSSRVYIFKATQDVPCWKCDNGSCDGTKCKLSEPQIVKNPQLPGDMNLVEAKRVIVQALKEKMLSFEAANFIREHFVKKYGETWACIIHKSGDSSAATVALKPSFFVNIRIGKLDVAIYKPFQKSP